MAPSAERDERYISGANDGKPLVGALARQSLAILVCAGLVLKFYTVALRNKEYASDPRNPLRVRYPIECSLSISEKTLGRTMECLGDVESTHFNYLVGKKTGHPRRVRECGTEFWQDNLM